VDLIKTPIGNVEEASFIAPICIYLIDLFVYVIAISIIIYLSGFYFFMQNQPGATAGAVSMLLAALMFALAFLCHREKIPSVGYWAMGVRRFEYGKLSEYSGRGFLYVKEGQKPSTLIKRVLILIMVIGVSISVLSNLIDLV
jgi:hypothetical protein